MTHGAFEATKRMAKFLYFADKTPIDKSTQGLLHLGQFLYTFEGGCGRVCFELKRVEAPTNLEELDRTLLLQILNEAERLHSNSGIRFFVPSNYASQSIQRGDFFRVKLKPKSKACKPKSLLLFVPNHVVMDELTHQKWDLYFVVY